MSLGIVRQLLRAAGVETGHWSLAGSLFAVAPLEAMAEPADRGGTAYALCIGNSEYAASQLLNPANDAEDVAALCRALGFDTQLLLQANLDRMLDAVDTFSMKLERGDVALFYFAGKTHR